MRAFRWLPLDDHVSYANDQQVLPRLDNVMASRYWNHGSLVRKSVKWSPWSAVMALFFWRSHVAARYGRSFQWNNSCIGDLSLKNPEPPPREMFRTNRMHARRTKSTFDDRRRDFVKAAVTVLHNRRKSPRGKTGSLPNVARQMQQFRDVESAYKSLLCSLVFLV